MNGETFLAYDRNRGGELAVPQAGVNYDMAAEIDKRNGWTEPGEKDPEVQDKVDMLSLRAQGDAKDAKPGAEDVHSQMVGQFVLGAGKLLGVSTHSVEEACCAAKDGADFIVFGPVFTTPSKVTYGPPQGLQHLTTVVRAVSIPVIAIGGIDHTNLPQVVHAGAYGVAMIRAVLAAPDPYKATQQLRAALAATSQV